MNSRERLLSALRAQHVEKVPLPPLAGPWSRYPDALEQFTLAVKQAAGSVLRVQARSELAAAVASLEVVGGARSVCSLVAGVPGTVAAGGEARDHAELGVVVIEAEFGVAENGALWVPEPAVLPRAALFLAEHVVCVLPASELVHTMHDAYERLGAGFGSYGCFMSGPSKTADIEQALVIGAHGARSLTVCLV